MSDSDLRHFEALANKYEKALKDIVACYDNEDMELLDPLDIAEEALKDG